MTGQNGWPQAGNEGIPLNPDTWGPHLIIDEFKRKRWAIWQPYGKWLMPDRECGPMFSAEWTYLGPAVEPAEQG